MKKLFLLLVLAGGIYSGNTANAQLKLSINIGAQPVWGPTGYDHAEYYYIPDADAYYDVNARVFMYQEGGRWISGPELPGQYRNVDLYTVHKVVINKPSPWLHDNVYRKQYASFRGRHDQHAIRDSHEAKYYQNPGHPQHDQWMKQHGNDMHHDNGHHDNGHHDDHRH